MRRLLFAIAAAFTTAATFVLPATLASAESANCHLSATCQVITDQHPLGGDALQTVTGSPDSNFVGVPVSSSQRQDFTIQRIGTSNRFRILFTPQGVPTTPKLALEEVGGLNSHLKLNVWDGDRTQQWHFDAVSPGNYNITNSITGLAITHDPGHGVRMRHLYSGTGAGKVWTLPKGLPSLPLS